MILVTIIGTLSILLFRTFRVFILQFIITRSVMINYKMQLQQIYNVRQQIIRTRKFGSLQASLIFYHDIK